MGVKLYWRKQQAEYISIHSTTVYHMLHVEKVGIINFANCYPLCLITHTTNFSSLVCNIYQHLWYIMSTPIT